MDAADEMVTKANATMETAIQMLEMAKMSMADAKRNKAAALMHFDVSRRERKDAGRLLGRQKIGVEDGRRRRV